MPEISIIVPVYKTEAYLSKCIDSILSQTFQDFELILIDDGSPDLCGQICDDYEKRDSRVVVIHKANAGVSAARNAGLEIAVGTYIMFCDSDDYVDADWCKTMFEAAEANPEKGIVCNGWRENIDGTQKHAIAEHMGDKIEEKTYFDIYKLYISGSACLRIFRRDIIKNLGLRFEVGKPVGEDAAFCAQYARSCEGHMYIHTPLYFYIYNPHSAVNKYYWNTLELHLPLFLERLPLIQPEETAEFCDIHFAYFVNMFDVVFDSRNEMSFFQKMRYNHKMIRSTAFRTCVHGVTGSKESPIVLKIIRLHNYYVYWLFKKLIECKSLIFK